MTVPSADIQLLARISSAVIGQAVRTRLLVETGRFLAIIDKRTDTPWASFALPDPGQLRAGPLDVHEGLAGLKEVFLQHGRQLRFELFEGLWPGLVEELARAGFPAVARQPILVLEPRGLLSPSGARVTVQPLGAADPDASIALLLRIQASAFGGEAGERGAEPGPADIARKREELLAGAQRCCLGFLGDKPAGAGSALVAGDICEIAGIGTLREYRGMGVGSAVSAALAREHFDRGGSLAWLTAGDEAACRVYKRIGFRPTGAFQVVCEQTVGEQTV